MQDPLAGLKRQAAQEAAALVKEGMVVGLGTGSTATFLIDFLGQRWKEEGLRFVAIPSSERSARQAQELGIKLTDFAANPVIDLTIDGADEVQRGTLNLIKGLGGALLREKIVAASSKRLVIIVDESKIVDKIGQHHIIPVEVVPFGWEATAHTLKAMGADVTLRKAPEGSPYVTDGGHYILDCGFGVVEDPARLEQALNMTVGVVENGLFINRATEIIVAAPSGVNHMKRA